MATEETQEDREMRADGEQYAAEKGGAFVAAHAKQLAGLVTTYNDAEAQEMFDRLREAFWARTWKGGRVMATKTMNGAWARFDDMTWPCPGDRLREVEHALRYGTATRTDLMTAASVMKAYAQMVHDPRRKREHVIRKLREVK
jgi:hypothetical protein